jgi:hypothetical protein
MAATRQTDKLRIRTNGKKKWPDRAFEPIGLPDLLGQVTDYVARMSVSNSL